MLSKIIEDFEKEFPNWSKIDSAQFDLAKIMTRWQDPKTADSILKGTQKPCRCILLTNISSSN